MVSALWFIFAVAKQKKYKPMSKDTNFIGQPVYVQLSIHVNRERIKKISSRGGHFYIAFGTISILYIAVAD